MLKLYNLIYDYNRGILMRFLFFITILFVSACSSRMEMLESSFICPRIGFIKNAEKTEIKDKNIKVKISNVMGECSLGYKDTQLDMSLVFEAGIMKEAKIEESIKLKYFVSVLSNSGKIILKKVFSTKLDFDASGYSRKEEDHIIRLPIKEVADVNNYEIVMGFVKEEKK